MKLSANSILRLFSTLRYLKPTQLAFLALRRGLPAKRVKLTVLASAREGRQLQPLLPVTTFQQSEHSFHCLNTAVEFDAGNIDWAPSGQSRLWCYHLHYFDQLRDPRRSHENKQFLVDDWIKANPQGSQPAWEPYTVSLRIVNWVAFFLSDAVPQQLPQYWLNSLYQQALWLEQNDERHILANHYFENIKAWLFAGVFLQGDGAERWLAKGKRLLLAQLQEQFLADGGHYERSAHYHALMLENILDLLNLSKSNSGVLGAEVETALEVAATEGLEFLHRITYPNGTIPLFNDAVQSAAPSVDALYTYAVKLFFIQVPERPDDLVLIDESDSGFYGYRQGGDMLLIDCGEIGPDYQPGHTHCDFLSFELVWDGEPLIVDTGLYEYQAGEMREYVRSTVAHNTVAVDNREQSEIWGEFRVARRARRRQAKIKRNSDGTVEFFGSYNGFPQISGGITHQRIVSCDLTAGGGLLAVYDEVRGQGIHTVASYLHFHPDIELHEEGTGRWRLTRAQRTIAHLIFGDAAAENVTTRVKSGWYCPEFGLKCKNQILVLTVKNVLPISMSYRIERVV